MSGSILIRWIIGSGIVHWNFCLSNSLSLSICICTMQSVCVCVCVCMLVHTCPSLLFSSICLCPPSVYLSVSPSLPPSLPPSFPPFLLPLSQPPFLSHSATAGGHSPRPDIHGGRENKVVSVRVCVWEGKGGGCVGKGAGARLQQAHTRRH